MEATAQLSRPRFIFRLLLGILAGALALPLVTWLLGYFYLRQSHHNVGWLDLFVSLFRRQLPLTGALLGAFSASLWWSRRGLVTRSACFLCAVVVLYLTYGWFLAYWTLDARFRPPRGLLVMIATPVSLWALLLVFFSLVARERSQGLSTLSAS